MKKYFATILIFIIILAVFLPISVTYAQTPNSTGGCNPLWNFNLGNCIAGALGSVAATVAYFILTIVSYILWLAGSILDFVMRYTIIDMRAHIAGLTGINIAWKMIKDLMNIVFIFMLVYQGIKLIIGMESVENIKKFIIGIVLSALLINFSLFFTKVLIDASNVVSVGFYNAIIATSRPVTLPTGTGGVLISGISAPFMEKLGVTRFWASGSLEQIRQQAGGNLNMVLLPSLGVLLFVVIAFVFFTISIIFAVRFVVLIILLVLSPIGFMGMALSSMQQYANKWWNALNSQLLFAPIYMIMTWVILRMMGARGFLTLNGNESWADLIRPTDPQVGVPQSGMSLLFNFFIVIALAIASLIISKDTSKKGSEHIGKLTGQATAATGAALFGGSAWLGRNTVGRYGNYVASNEDLKDRASRGDVSARLQLAAANKAAGSTFDVRASKSFDKLSETGGMKNAFGKVDLKKDTFKAKLEEERRKQEEIVKMYKPSDLAVRNAESTLDSKEFKAREEKALEDHLKSDKFKTEEKELSNKMTKVEEEENKIKELENNEQKDTTRLRQLVEQKLELTGQDELMRKEEIENLKKKIDADKKLAEELKKNESERNKVKADYETYKNRWMSKEKEELIAMKGGQKEERNNKGQITQSSVPSRYQVRAAQAANRYENGGIIRRGYEKVTNPIIEYSSRIGGAVVGGTAGAVAGSYLGPEGVAVGLGTGAVKGWKAGGRLGQNMVNARKQERQETARRLMKQAGGKKSVDERLKEILKDEGEIKEKEETPTPPPTTQATPEAPKTT